jgi:hypothetical protein
MRTMQRRQSPVQFPRWPFGLVRAGESSSGTAPNGAPRSMRLPGLKRQDLVARVDVDRVGGLAGAPPRRPSEGGTWTRLLLFRGGTADGEQPYVLDGYVSIQDKP